MNKRKNPVKDLNIKQRLTSYYFKGTLSLVLLGVLLLTVGVIIFNRFRNAGLIKELSMASFNLDLNLEQNYQQISTAFTIEMILIILLWIIMILYFVGWYFRRGRIRLDAVIVYTLLGIVISTIVYLTYSQAISSQVFSLTAHQACVLDTACEVKASSEDLILKLGEQVNSTYFIIQTSVIAMLFFTILSFFQLIIDRVRKIIRLVRIIRRQEQTL